MVKSRKSHQYITVLMTFFKNGIACGNERLREMPKC